MQSVLQTAYPALMHILSGRFRRNRSGCAEAAPWLGVKNVLPKPLTLKRLLSAVDALLEGRAMRVVARYALAPFCILLAALLYLSPAGPSFNLPSLFLFAVLAAAWFGQGDGPIEMLARRVDIERGLGDRDLIVCGGVSGMPG
jgi:hypothetical protein